MDTYTRLLKQGKKIQTLKGIFALLHWDQETYMPQEGASPRADQLELLAGIIHKEETGKSFSNKLKTLIDLETATPLVSLESEKLAALREWRRSYLQTAKLPQKFVKALAKLSSQATHAWQQAKKEDNFHAFAPYLKKIVSMNRQKAEYLGYEEHPYDALIDQHEPGMTKKKLTELFTELKEPLKQILQTALHRQRKDLPSLQGAFSDAKQLEAGHFFLREMGYDFTKGRLDLSAHPFSISMHPHDSRVTTRLDHFFMNTIGSVLHEGGHALYEMGLPSNQYGSPLCEAASLGIHESQSRFWETRIGQSKAFWQGYLPYLSKHFGFEMPLTDFYQAINLVCPSFIRVDADEVTYSFHVILRFEIECRLLEGSLSVEELPRAWNDKMEQYLGVRPPTNREGCLQDVHWSMGELGYFPTYTLGNLYAAHFFQGFEKAHPDWEERVARRDLGFIKAWLQEHIHQHGRRYLPTELVERAAGGKSFSSRAYVEYLKKKYLQLSPSNKRLVLPEGG